MLYFERALCVRSLNCIVRTLSCIIRTRFARVFVPLLASLVPFRPLFVPLLELFVPLLALFLPLAPSAADRLDPCRIGVRAALSVPSRAVCLFVSSPLGCVFRPSADAEGRTRGRRFRRRRRRLRLTPQVRRCVSERGICTGRHWARAHTLAPARAQAQADIAETHTLTHALARKGPVTHPSVHAPTLRCR